MIPIRTIFYHIYPIKEALPSEQFISTNTKGTFLLLIPIRPGKFAACVVQIWTVALISYERHLTILSSVRRLSHGKVLHTTPPIRKHPLTASKRGNHVYHWTRGQVVQLILALWTSALLLSSCPLLGWNRFVTEVRAQEGWGGVRGGLSWGGVRGGVRVKVRGGVRRVLRGSRSHSVFVSYKSRAELHLFPELKQEKTICILKATICYLKLECDCLPGQLLLRSSCLGLADYD